MVVCRKKQKQCLPEELEADDCWIGLSLANTSGLILAARVRKHTDEFIEELVVTAEGKTGCKHGIATIGVDMSASCHQRLSISLVKDGTQRLERTNGIVRQQTGRWHRR